MISTILFYVFSSSAVLFYGIGINRLISLNRSRKIMLFSYMKSLAIVCATTSICFLLNELLLFPLELAELFPFFAVTIFIIVSLLVEIFVNIGIGNSMSEFAVPLLAIIIGLNEGTTIPETIIISIISISVFYILYGIIFCLRCRIKVHTPDVGLKIYSILSFSLGIIVLALYGLNVSWFNNLN